MKQGQYVIPALILGSLCVFVLGFSAAYAFQDEEKIYDAELAVSDLSPNGEAGGRILSASCESGYAHGGFCPFLTLRINGDEYNPTSGVPDITVSSGGSAQLKWYLQVYPNPTAPVDWYTDEPFTILSCDASGGWSGSKPFPTYGGPGWEFYVWGWGSCGSTPCRPWSLFLGYQNLSSLNASMDYTFTCSVQLSGDGSIQTDTETVTIYVTPPAPVVNAPPSAPSIGGPTTVTSGEVTTSPFSFTSTDPNGDAIRYLIHWSDPSLNPGDWQRLPENGLFVASGATVWRNHLFGSIGGRYIYASAFDAYNNQSATSSYYVTVNAPAGMSATLSSNPTICEIPVNGNRCNIPFTWNIVGSSRPNLFNATLLTEYTGAASGSNVPYQIAHGSNTIRARNDVYALISISVTGTCASGSVWNGSICRQLLGCTYNLDASGNPITTINTDKTPIPSGSRFKVTKFGGEYCFGNSGGPTYLVPLNSWTEFYSFWNAIPRLSGMFTIPSSL